jgi:hypothetical protein
MFCLCIRKDGNFVNGSRLDLYHLISLMCVYGHLDYLHVDFQPTSLVSFLGDGLIM